jgi:hypothetical protein
MARRARNPRRKSITLRDIAPPAVMASDLYQAAYAPVVALWQRAGERIAVEYERTLSGMTRDSADDLRSLLEQATDEFARLFLLLRPGIAQWAIGVERWQRTKWRGAVLSATGVDVGTMIGPETARETLATYIEWNVALVKDVSAEAQKRISTAVFEGLTTRRPAREVAATIRESTAMTKRRSVGIASDQLSKATSALADERRREAGLDLWQWKHSMKLHPRAEHKVRDGDIYSDTSDAVGTTVEGKVVKAAPDDGDRPGRKPWCGCRSLGVLVFD